MSDDEPDACGIKPVARKKDPFIHACAWHDQAYIKGSWAQKNLSRKTTDEHFYDQMLHIAGDSRYLKIKAALYYRIARLLGWYWWEGKK